MTSFGRIFWTAFFRSVQERLNQFPSTHLLLPLLSLKLTQLGKKHIAPPYHPQLEGDTDLQNFDPIFTDEDPILTPSEE